MTYSGVLQQASLLCVAGGLVAGLLVLGVSRDARAALRVALDMWLAAGLLRLALPPAWDQLLAAAAILVIRQLVRLSLRRAPADRSTAAPGG
jgi:hypothetical protein